MALFMIREKSAKKKNKIHFLPVSLSITCAKWRGQCPLFSELALVCQSVRPILQYCAPFEGFSLNFGQMLRRLSLQL